MRKALGLAIAAATCVSGCAYYPVPPDPIRIQFLAADVSACHRLGSVGIARTDGFGPVEVSELTAAVRAPNAAIVSPTPQPAVPVGPNFAVRLNIMRDAALNLRATDLLIRKRYLRDWSYVEGVAYRCPR